VQDGPVDAKPKSALDSLYREQAGRLWRAIFAFTGDPEVTSDAVAEAFAQYLRRGAEVRSPIAWLWKAALRIAAGEMKRRGSLSTLADDHSYEIPEKAWDLVAALRSLPERQRAVLVLHYYAGYPTREIGSILGASPATVRVHLSKGRRRLQELVRREDND
jgi:RNA polymerase sigma-70 factor, ECF subfamily